MNYIRFVAITFICICCYALSSNAQTVTYEGEGDGVMMLSVSEFNIKKKDAIEQAIKDAYFQVLFRGIPGSAHNNRALLGTDENVMNASRQYYDAMINRGRLYSFVTYAAISYYKREEAVVQLSLNIQALISDLERQNLYRRFGVY